MARHSDPSLRHTELVPDIFDTGTEKLPSSGQFSAAMLAGCLLAAAEALIAPAIFATTIGVSVLTWWILDAPWAGRRRHSSHASRRWYLPKPRTVYLSTLMLMGLWLATMFVFRASDPKVSGGFGTTLPDMMLGVDVSVLSKMNGMQGPLDTATMTMLPKADDVAPFSLFAHGTASTVAVALLTYALQSARRRFRRARRSRDAGEQQGTRHPGSAR